MRSDSMHTTSSVGRDRFDRLFENATGFRPHGYQVRLACGEQGTHAKDDWLSNSSPCRSELINIPTGFGKTSAVVLAWIWNRVTQGREDWPRRLVYSLPMRTLVEQTYENAAQWLDRVGLREEVGLQVLMGGEDAGDWDTQVERNAIVVGTQDMLLSRALNRGYGMSRYRWPMHFALLNNDCLWIMDEVQLMGPGLWTSAQLDWMRTDRFQSLKPCFTWMSATMRSTFLKTPDRRNADLPDPRSVTLDVSDEAHEILRARRPCDIWEPPTSGRRRPRGSPADDHQSTFTRALATAVTGEHQEASLSLVVCNTVSVAQRVYAAIRAVYAGSSAVILLTSRFRARDRDENQAKLLAFETDRKRSATDQAIPVVGVICVSTQVIEAGVDISARRLWSEVSPWPSVIQRLGRLNRDGRQNGDSYAWFWEGPDKPKQNQPSIGPYVADAVRDGHKLIRGLVAEYKADGKLAATEALAILRSRGGFAEVVEGALAPDQEPCPRAIDVHGLFSTEPDIFGGFTDVSPFVRNQDGNADVTVFWREWTSSAALRRSEGLSGPAFAPDEGCAVAVSRFREFVDKRNAWIWNDRIERWETVGSRDICPGMLLMLPLDAGGYSRELGWTGSKQDKLDNAPPPGEPHETFEDDRHSENGVWVTLATHLGDTKREAECIVRALGLDRDVGAAVVHACAAHDVGKALPKWQGELPKPTPSESDVWAKAPYQFATSTASSNVRSEIEAILRKYRIRHQQAEWSGQEVDEGETIFTWHTNSRVSGAALVQLRAVPDVKRVWNLPFRPNLRHEAATALALWHRYYRSRDADFPALSIYLSATHHGKVRTVLTSRNDGAEDVCGISKSTELLPWKEMPLDFACAVDGAAGRFSEDGRKFFFEAPGWTGLVADLLGAWEPDATHCSSGAVPSDEPHALGPFALAYLELLVRCADERASSKPSAGKELGQ